LDPAVGIINEEFCIRFEIFDCEKQFVQRFSSSSEIFK
jgi:hypothetical protein